MLGMLTTMVTVVLIIAGLHFTIALAVAFGIWIFLMIFVVALQAAGVWLDEELTEWIEGSGEE